MYLSDVPEGGFTLFPTIGNHSINQEMKEVFTNAFEKGLFSLFISLFFRKKKRSLVDRMVANNQFLISKENRRVIFPPPHWNDTAFEICNKMCRGEIPALRIKPKKGSAIMFPSRHPDGHPDPVTWHGACRVKTGEKWTLQKFKEFPRKTGEWAVDPEWSAEAGSKNPPQWVSFHQQPSEPVET